MGKGIAQLSARIVRHAANSCCGMQIKQECPRNIKRSFSYN